ncbi:hypothetical protein [Peterkaempfera bronchialis]|uniref:hypothetical protein n=1 Tax=Peterkaempfera bronchialis TaxID=2126346 RepID=UPI000DAE36CF|nr:hypothetical protein [Peterkaempfera bronchialis]
MTTWPLPRAVRATVFGAVCTALAGAAHLGMSPTAELPVRALLVGFAGTALLSGLLSGLLGRVRGGHCGGPTAAGAWTVTVQAALHLLLEHAGSAQSTGPGCAHAMADMPAASPHGGPPAEMAAGMPVGMPVGMAAAHLLAAVGCALVMRRGEAALGRVFEALCALAFAPLLLLRSVRPATAGPVRRRTPRRARSPRLLLLSYALVTRGPPQAARPI